MNSEKKSQCRFLRSKKTYVPDLDHAESWRTADTTTQPYWCLRTMTTAGPDNQLVAPERCQKERTCYQEVDLVV
ncbi:MAG: hypothetical protein ACE5HO_06475 [bacterium]